GNSDAELRALAVRSDSKDLELELTAPLENDEDQRSSRTEPANDAKPLIKSANQVLGFAPVRGVGKLTPVRGVRMIRDNYGLAVLDHAAPGEPKFAIIPQHKAWWRINDAQQALAARN